MDLRARLVAASALASLSLGSLMLPLTLRAQETPAPAAARPDAAAATPRQRPGNGGGAAANTPEGELPIPAETTSVTHHDWSAGGRTVHYTATAGTLYVYGEGQDAKPIGTMFYTAYTEDGAPAKSRPVTFLYNGGPGSATIWLHMGSVGPIRVVTKSPEASGAPPYEWVQNQYSLIDKSDLVFIDAPLTGYGRLVGKGKATDFQGVDQDVRAFNKFITRYITLNQRWSSPKYLFGESYGTPRSAALVASLNNDGIAFNGVTLLSSVLNYFVNSPGYDLDTKRYIPSYAAIAWYYKKVPQTGSMKDFVQKAREFSRGEYSTALDQGDMLPPAEFDAVAAKLASFTGLSVEYCKQSKLRIEPTRFRKELLRDKGEILGRYDARFDGVDTDNVGETPGYDPSDTGINGVYVGAFHEYLQTELKYNPNTEYDLRAPGGNWDWHHRPSGARMGGGGGGNTGPNEPDTVLDLSDAMRKNPSLRVFSANGWFDLATPFFGTEHDLAQLMLPPAQLGNVKFGYYPAGHMVYLNVDALKEMHADLEKWYSEK
ncbi:S10 family peptidase [Granulicella paludicola]|uniref:S10 family peptidase n=1 Tax=Granulicella paludicola TaxID=474951 RepID=UPI0021E0845F|nr:peptidase S10 [Granulicella paludicola]